MPRPDPAPNRTLHLDELDRPAFSEHIAEMEELVEREEVSYLHPGKRWEYPWALERAALEPGSRVLDAGCGDSIFPVYLAVQGYRVTALDRRLSGGLDALHGVRVGYTGGDLTRLPLREDSQDAVFCISVVEHLAGDGVSSALQEMRRVLRPGAPLLLTTDYYQDAGAEIWYEGEDRRFPVEWEVFDEERFRRLVLGAPGFRLSGEIDLSVDWDRVRPRMRAFHGYPYTSVGAMLVKTG